MEYTPSTIISGTDTVLTISRAFIPVAAVAVISNPAAIVSHHALIPRSSAVGIVNMATPTPNQPICVNPRTKEDRYAPLVPKARRHRRSILRPVPDPICARTPQYTDRMIPPARHASTNPERSSPFPSLAPTLILAEKNVNPSITKNMLRKPRRADSGTGARE